MAQNFFLGKWLSTISSHTVSLTFSCFFEGFFPFFVLTFYSTVAFPRQRENKFEIQLASSSRTKRVVAFAFITFITSITR